MYICFEGKHNVEKKQIHKFIKFKYNLSIVFTNCIYYPVIMHKFLERSRKKQIL